MGEQGGKLFLEPMCPVFRTPGDGLPSQGDGTTRAKVIHTVGVVGRVEWRDLGGHDYSGIFKGAQHGLARLSLALEPDTSKLNTAPGMGLKFLRFHPTGNITFSDNYVRPTNQDLVTIPSGSVLYQVFALDVPEQLGGKEKRIADLVLTSEVVPSRWGDEHLFIRHQDMAEDLRLRPEWNQYTPQYSLFLRDADRPSPCDE